VLQFNKAYLQWKSMVAWKRLSGSPYMKKGPATRGEAMPIVDPLQTRS